MAAKSQVTTTTNEPGDDWVDWDGVMVPPADVAILTEKLPKEAIKSRSLTRDKNGPKAPYVEGHTVIHILNKATRNRWHFGLVRPLDIREKPPRQDGGHGGFLAIAHVYLELPGRGRREHIGVQDFTYLTPDLLKGALTDALKKAASLFGVGLELYGEDYAALADMLLATEDDAPALVGQTPPPSSPQGPTRTEPQRDLFPGDERNAPADAVPKGTSHADAPRTQPEAPGATEPPPLEPVATKAQADAIRSLWVKLFPAGNPHHDKLGERLFDKYAQTEPEALTKSQAIEIITVLQQSGSRR